ncbi:autophagy-related protein 13-domain-containing protein [Kockovaella imperatae]|uniref:Autophagy-related protein 13 n=1 Tax=Kockovaella imperatae TaxID=4999 RepID=A0A1Y1UST5_9TREE|nr:autophagy-related protein 13-domain-containing protein [Kockovaella imperatae]ORX41078.1 autophagy-related protein 13-domain-containing protein [Kockovaella imperatae]
MARPANTQRSSSNPSPVPLLQSPSRDAGSASSSVVAAGPSRSDQIVHRYYLKTVAVLVEGRLTHYSKQDKKDKWFNLTIPDVDLHRADLAIYKSISNYDAEYRIPPLLIAFILDTSDLTSGQALMWSKAGAKYTLDPSGKGKGKANGIVLERWTLNASTPDSSSSMAPHTAYRLGIIHFRALFALVRLLPAYRLFRRLRRANSGLRLGIKLWGPEGYTNDAAWQVMERGLIGLGVGLDQLALAGAPAEVTEVYEPPETDLFGTKFGLRVEYRPEVDFSAEDMESILSEKFVDMDEEWFKPTVTASRKVSAPTPIPSTSPIPQRQTATGASGRSTSSRWGSLVEGLPFATPLGTSPSSIPSGAAVAARRLSGHSVHPFNASPSTSQLRQTPPIRPGSSVGRNSSFLSQSGRSFTHAQLANMSPSPPIPSPISPSSLSFTKQPIPRPVGATSPGTSPQVVKRLTSQNSTLLRRTSTRTSQESGLRHSVAGPDDDEIQSFLQSLDAIPQPSMIASQAVHASRSHLPSASSSVSVPSAPSSPAMQASGETRAPMTRQQVDDALKQMMGSFNVSPPRPSLGLLSASRPISSIRRPVTAAQSPPERPSDATPGPRSLPGSERPAKSPAITALLSPQTTGSSAGGSRRGPVLLRGGFEPHFKTSTSSSPSHSPIRDFARLGLGTTTGSRSRKTPGQRTAPSSFGGPVGDNDEERGRRGGPLSDKGEETGESTDPWL